MLNRDDKTNHSKAEKCNNSQTLSLFYMYTRFGENARLIRY
jgi:hypothetical protein